MAADSNQPPLGNARPLHRPPPLLIIGAFGKVSRRWNQSGPDSCQAGQTSSWKTHTRSVGVGCLCTCTFSTKLCKCVHFIAHVCSSFFFSLVIVCGLTPRQYSGKPKPCQEKFGVLAEISSCRGAAIEETSKTTMCLAELPSS